MSGYGLGISIYPLTEKSFPNSFEVIQQQFNALLLDLAPF